MPTKLIKKEGDYTLIAGDNVKHLTGGPEMSLVGFIHPTASDLYKRLGKNLSRRQDCYLGEKIYINAKFEMAFYPSLSSEQFYGHIFNRNGEFMNWYDEGEYISSFKCLCRYYSEKDKDFIYKVFSPFELKYIELNN